MKTNGSPSGPIMQGIPGQDAQEARDSLKSLLGHMKRLGDEQGTGLPVSSASAPTLMAAHAICLHLHHLTMKLGKLDCWNSLADMNERLLDMEERLGELENPV